MSIASGGGSVTLTALNKDGHWTHILRKLMSPPSGAWEFRFEFQQASVGTYYYCGLAAMLSNPGAAWDYEGFAAAGNYAAGVGYGSTSVGTGYLYAWAQDGTTRTTGTVYNIATGTRYYITASFSPTGGVGGVSRLTVTIRTGSHTGTVVSTQTVDFAADRSGVFKYFAPHWGGGWFGAGSRTATFTEYTFETDFDHGSNDVSAKIPAGPDDDFETYSPQDLTAFDEVDTENDFAAPSANLLDGTNGVNKDSAEAHYSKTVDVQGDFLAFAEVAATSTGLYDPYYMGGCPGLADVQAARKDIESGGDNAVCFGYIYAATKKCQLSEIDGGSLYQASGTVTLLNAQFYFLVLERDETIGTYGRLYGRVKIGHPFNIRSMDAVQLDLHSKRDFTRFFAFQSAHDVGSGTRNFIFDVKNVCDNWDETPPPPTPSPSPRILGKQIRGIRTLNVLGLIRG